MARLTDIQLAALRVASRGIEPSAVLFSAFRRRAVAEGRSTRVADVNRSVQASLSALRRRGLLERDPRYRHVLTEAGRRALVQAEHPGRFHLLALRAVAAGEEPRATLVCALIAAGRNQAARSAGRVLTRLVSTGRLRHGFSGYTLTELGRATLDAYPP